MHVVGTADPRVVRSALKALLEPLAVRGHLFLRLAAHDERHEQLADSVALEVEGDRDTGACARVKRLDRHVHSRADRPVDAVIGPHPRRSELRYLRLAPALAP